MRILGVVLTKSKKKIPVGGHAIRWWTSVVVNGWRGFFKLWGYSHVARSTQIRDWGKRYFQASGAQVNYEHETYFNQKHEIVKEYNIEISKEMDGRIKKACYKEAGAQYGTMQNVGIFLTDLYFKICKSNTKNPWHKGRNCSEIIYADALKLIIPTLDYNENKIKPHEIEEIILEHFEEGEDGIWRLK